MCNCLIVCVMYMYTCTLPYSLGIDGISTTIPELACSEGHVHVYA